MDLYLQVVGNGIVFSLLTMIIFWSWGRSKDNYGVVDVGWGVVNMGIVWVYFLSSGQILKGLSQETVLIPKVVLVGMITIWGLRLAFFLWWTRIRPGHPEDKRYNAFRKDYGDRVHQKFLTNVFLFQGLLALILTSPFLPLFLEQNHEFGILGYLGVSLFLIGQIGEFISDNQLFVFVNTLSNRGKVCTIGFWKYTRHPNYFFEWVIWLGMSLVTTQVHWIGILPALFMYVLLVHITGIPYAEKYSLMSKGELYKEYQRKTNSFFPWFPKI